MKRFRLIFGLALGVATVFASDTPAEKGDRVEGRGAGAIPPVLRNSESAETLVVTLPGPHTTPPPVVPPPPPAPPPERMTLPAVPRQQPPTVDPRWPAEFRNESATFCQRQVGGWTETEARALLGPSHRQRPAVDDDNVENGRIYAFSDPTGRYKELELDFDRRSGRLRTVFAYPWKMTWQECRRRWDGKVSATKASKGRTFYSYLGRRLDVLVDPAGLVISLGLY